MEAYFVSDVHLRDMAQPEADVLLGFLRDLAREGRATHLFLLGDIFDLWISGHTYFVQRFAPLVAEIKGVVRAGVRVHYLEGNHDLDLEHFWQDEVGVRVHSGPRLFELGGVWVRVEHGDLVDPADRGYRFLHWLLRTMPVRRAIRRLPGGLMARVGKAASHTSRAYTSRHKTISPERARVVVRTYAERMVQEEPFDLIVTGHLHVRDDYEFEYRGRRVRSVNLGWWRESPCAFLLADRSQGFTRVGGRTGGRS